MVYNLRLSAVTLALMLSCLAASLPAQNTDESLKLAQLAQQNRQLRERLQLLEARREAFRWGRFSEGPVLRTGTVISVSPLPDGRLAFATDEQGLILYDGSRFEVLDTATTALTDNFVTAVAAADTSLLYIGTGSGLFVYQNGKVRAVEGLPAGIPVSCLASGSDGRLWVGTQGSGLWLLQSGAWRNWRAESDSAGLAGNDINDLATGLGPDELWAVTAGGGVSHFNAGAWETFQAPLGPGSEEIYSVTLDTDGLVWIGTVGAGAGFWDGAGWMKAPLPVEEGEGVVQVSLIDGGDLFFGTTSGAWIYRRGENRWERLPVPRSWYPTRLFPAPNTTTASGSPPPARAFTFSTAEWSAAFRLKPASPRTTFTTWPRRPTAVSGARPGTGLEFTTAGAGGESALPTACRTTW